MKYLFGLVVLLSLCACAHQPKPSPSQDNSQLAKVVNDRNSVLVLTVNGKEIEPDSLAGIIGGPDQFNAYLLPGLTRFTIQYSYKGFVATSDDRVSIEAFATPRIEDICIELSAGTVYRISSETFSGVASVRGSDSASESQPVNFIDCIIEL